MKPAVRIGIALGAVALALGIGVATILAVDYRAELHCSPLSGNGVTDHTNCTISGDHRWASHYGPISGDACSFSAYFDTNTWVLTRSATVFPDGTLNQYSVSGGTVVYWDNFGDCPSAPPPYTGIQLLSSDEQAPSLSIPNAAGATACGVFDVNGWGAKYVGMGDFPGCTAPVTVMCLNGDGEWTADTVSDVVMHGDWEVDFISSQDGTCGLFEQ